MFLVLHWIDISIVDAIERFVVCDWSIVSLCSSFHDGELKCFRLESIEHQLSANVSRHDPVLLVRKIIPVDGLRGGLDDESVVAEANGLHHITVRERFLASAL